MTDNAMLTITVVKETNFTAAEAKARLENYDSEIFRETCYYSHKDQYGVKGHHLLKAPHDHLVDWWLAHYNWNEKEQYWDSIIPFN
jgi:hypothetical protein